MQYIYTSFCFWVEKNKFLSGFVRVTSKHVYTMIK